MPGVPQPSVLEQVHRSCRAVTDTQQLVTLDQAAINAYAAQLDVEAVAAAEARSGVAFPIKFEDQEVEVTFLALYHLLDFGSGYDVLLRASTAGRGWRETVQYGCFGLALSHRRLDAAWMAAFSLYNLHSAFGFDSKVEEELQPGITISKAGPLAPLAQAIHSTIVETGKVLQAAGAKSLGDLILSHLSDVKAAGKPITAGSLVEELVDTIPGFQDCALFTPPSQPTPSTGPAVVETVTGTPNDSDAAARAAAAAAAASSSSFKAMFLRKASLLAAHLGHRFGTEDPRFTWTDSNLLPADSSPVLSAVLHKLGVMRHLPELDAVRQQAKQGAPVRPEELMLRAAAVAAVDAIVAAAGSSGAGSVSLDARSLSTYLLSQVQEEGGAQGRLLFAGDVLLLHQNLSSVAF